MKYKINYNKLEEGSHLYFNVFLHQTIQNIGTFTDHDDYEYTSNPITHSLSLTEKFGRPDNATPFNYLSPQTFLTFDSNSRIEALRPYGYDDFTTSLVLNEKNVVHKDGYPVVMGDKMEGIIYNDNKITYNYFIDGIIYGAGVFDTTYGFTGSETFISGDLLTASFTFKTQGNNLTNTSVSPIIKLEHLIGITDVLETKSDLFISRGKTSAYEVMLKMGDINNIEQLSLYGNGFFNIITE